MLKTKCDVLLERKYKLKYILSSCIVLNIFNNYPELVIINKTISIDEIEKNKKNSN